MSMPSPKTEIGLLLVDKPAGVTSHAVVAAARRALDERRIGHTGTLDPFATGLLLLLVGAFTRATEHFHVLPKTYAAVMRLGVETDTEDPSGAVVSSSEAWRDLDPAAVASEVAGLVGDHEQVLPAFSAKRVGGARAYDLARSGEAVELPAASITVHAARVTDVSLPEVSFEVQVSTGTYIRSLARDLGRALGCGAHLSSLRRTAIGPFAVAEAVAPEAIGPATVNGPAWRSAAAALEWLPRRALDESEASDVRHGRFLPTRSEQEGPIVLVHEGRLVAIAEAVEGNIRPRKVFA
jgi:tRNA pseudouridine55 synthase